MKNAIFPTIYYCNRLFSLRNVILLYYIHLKNYIILILIIFYIYFGLWIRFLCGIVLFYKLQPKRVSRINI